MHGISYIRGKKITIPHSWDIINQREKNNNHPLMGYHKSEEKNNNHPCMGYHITEGKK
jgi:hypothetical protein